MGLLQINWELVAKTWGPLGIGFVLLLVLIVGGAKWFKSTLIGSLDDARKERDYMRQQREREADKFIESLRYRDEIMRKGFDEILSEMRATRRK